jgi:PleD family two-component response regulator
VARERLTSASVAASRLEGVTVLIVDDVPQILTTVRAILERYGATVTAVGSADDAFEALQRECPNVLLSDLSMPGKSSSEPSSSSTPNERCGTRTPEDHPNALPHALPPIGP